MQLEYFQLTMVGDRDVNQDYMAHIVNDDYALFVVADHR
jgi:PPM family protein phosphatase